MAGFNAKEKRMVKILSSPVLWGQHYLRNRDGSASRVLAAPGRGPGMRR